MNSEECQSEAEIPLSCNVAAGKNDELRIKKETVGHVLAIEVGKP